MLWIKENKRNWRVVVLILLVLAFLGPWSFELIDVPAKYTCGPPYIRLEGDFCGEPFSGIQMVFGGIGLYITGSITGEIDFAGADFNLWMSFIYPLVLISLALPIINLLFLIRRGDRPRLQKFHLVVCGLNLVPVLLLGLSIFPKLFYVRWGAWLYFGVMVSILVMEGVLLKQRS